MKSFARIFSRIHVKNHRIQLLIENLIPLLRIFNQPGEDPRNSKVNWVYKIKFNLSKFKFEQGFHEYVARKVGEQVFVPKCIEHFFNHV